MVRRVLVVDDEPAYRESLSFNLEHEGYAVVAVADPDAALREWAQRPFALVITDLLLPGGVDGVALLRTLRQQRSDLPIVIVSGLAAEEVYQRLATLDAPLAVLEKPFGLDALFDTVRRMLGEHGRTQGAGPQRCEDQPR